MLNICGVLVIAFVTGGCASTPKPPLSPFERCFATMRKDVYTTTDAAQELADWCVLNNNGGIQ